MEEQIAQVLEENLGPLHIQEVSLVPRCSLSTCFVYTTDRGKIFVKTHHPSLPGMYEAEAKGLQHIDNTATVLVPKPVYYGEIKGHSLLVLEYLDLVPHTIESQKKLALQLAQLHKTRTTSPFGYDYVNYLGTTPQINQWTSDWVDFFSQYRLHYQLRLIEKQYQDDEVLRRGEEILAIIPRLFQGIRVQPSLLHGDLWNGNTAATVEGEPVVFDPCCYYGHHEAELSIAKMFGGFSPEFFAAYHSKIPKEKGFEQRQSLYQLYHMLNHYHLFGESYRDGTLALMKELL